MQFYYYSRFGKIYPGLHKIVNILKDLKELLSYKHQKNHPLVKNIMEGDWLIDYILLNINVQSHSLPYNNYFFSSFLSNYKKLYSELKPHFFISIIEILFYKFINFLWYATKEDLNKKEIVDQLTYEQRIYIQEVCGEYFIGNIELLIDN